MCIVYIFIKIEFEIHINIFKFYLLNTFCLKNIIKLEYNADLILYAYIYSNSIYFNIYL